MAVNVLHEYNSTSSDPPRGAVAYEAITIVFNNNVTDFDVKDQTTLFTKINWARELYVKTDNDIYIKLNDTDQDSIELWGYETFTSTGFPAENIFITAASGVKVRIVVYGWN